MTNIRELREPPAGIRGLTLADVLLHLQQLPDLDPKRALQMTSAVRTLGRVLDRPLKHIPAKPGWLRDALSGISPAAHGISKGRWANVRSLLRAGLIMAGVPVLAGRSMKPMSGPWADLYALLPEPGMQHALCRSIRLFTQWGIEPDAVTSATFERLSAALIEGELAKRPHQIYRDAVKAWNAAVATVPGWPQVPVPVPASRRVIYTKPWGTFPSSLEADVAAMIEAATRQEFGLGRRMPKIRQTTAVFRNDLLRALASALVDDGVPPAELSSIADLVDLDHAERGLRHLYARAGDRTSVQIHQTAILLCTLARHWVGVGEPHQARLDDLRRALDARHPGMTDKNRNTLRAFEDPHTLRRLLDLPEQVRRMVGRKDRLREVDAVRLQVALAIELLLVAPVRIRNLGRIHLDRNLIKVGDGRQARWHLFFPAAEVKNDVIIEMPLPPDTAKLLRHYLDEVRPTLERVPNRWLFPGEGSGHKQTNLLGLQIGNLVSEIVGVRVTAHQFRHLAGFLYLQQHPGSIEVVRRLLGHKQIQTTLAFYAGMEQAAAARHYDDHLAARRAEGLVGSPMKGRR